MIRHYIKIGLRSLSRQKGLSFINIAGLSIGLACFALFLLYAVNELSFDRMHTNASSIYRVYDWWAFQGKEPRSGIEPSSATPIGPAMKQDLPEVQEFVRIQHAGNRLARIEGKMQNVRMGFADPQLFTVFTFPVLYGNASTALKDPRNVVLTKDKRGECRWATHRSQGRG